MGRKGTPAITLSLQSEDPEETQEAVRACSRLFGALLERGELFVGHLPPEDMVMAGERPTARRVQGLPSGKVGGTLCQQGMSPQPPVGWVDCA